MNTNAAQTQTDEAAAAEAAAPFYPTSAAPAARTIQLDDAELDAAEALFYPARASASLPDAAAGRRERSELAGAESVVSPTEGRPRP